jgi:hypothetical protein
MILALMLLVADCGPICTNSAFELQIYGVTVDGLGDMDLPTCLSALEDIEPQTPPFTQILCVEVGVSRQKI